MKLFVLSVTLFAYLNVGSAAGIRQNDQQFLDLKRIQLRRPGEINDQNSQELHILSQLAQARPLRSNRREFSQRTGLSNQEPKIRPVLFRPSPMDLSPTSRSTIGDLSPYNPRPEHRPQNIPRFEANVRKFADQAQESSRIPEPENVPVIDLEQRTRPSSFVSDRTLFRQDTETPIIDNKDVRFSEQYPNQESPSHADRRRPHFPTHISKSKILPPKPPTEELVYVPVEEDAVIIKSSEIFDFPKREESKTIQQNPKEIEETIVLVPVTSYEGNPEPPILYRDELPAKVPKRKKVVIHDVRRQDKDFKKEKREIEAAETGIDPNGVQFAHDVQNAEAGTKNGRISFQLHGLKGPHSYRFGFDTGKGHNRQFRYEERDNYGEVKGRYGYYDNYGKLHIVNYSAHPKLGFAADVPKY